MGNNAGVGRSANSHCPVKRHRVASKNFADALLDATGKFAGGVGSKTQSRGQIFLRRGRFQGTSEIRVPLAASRSSLGKTHLRIVVRRCFPNGANVVGIPGLIWKWMSRLGDLNVVVVWFGVGRQDGRIQGPIVEPGAVEQTPNEFGQQFHTGKLWQKQRGNARRESEENGCMPNVSCRETFEAKGLTGRKNPRHWERTTPYSPLLPQIRKQCNDDRNEQSRAS